jgi:hypothetical protein
MGPEYVPLTNDLLRMFTIHVTMQFLYWAMDDTGAVWLFGADFVLLLVFVLLGVTVYHLVVDKLLEVR